MSTDNTEMMTEMPMLQTSYRQPPNKEHKGSYIKRHKFLYILMSFNINNRILLFSFLYKSTHIV